MAESKDYIVIQGQKFSKDMSDADIAFVLNRNAGFSKPKAERPDPQKATRDAYTDMQIREHQKGAEGFKNPNASAPHGMVESGLGKVIGNEAAARAVAEAPMAAAMVATAYAGGLPALHTGALFASVKGLTEGALGPTKTPRQAAKDFVWDTALVVTADKTMRTAAKVGGAIWDKFILSAATKTQEGINTLKAAENAAHDAVTKSPAVAGKTGDVTAAYKKFVDYIDSLPHGEGAVEGAYGKVQGAAKKLYQVVSADLGAVDVATGLPKPATQPLDALIRYESKWMQEAYHAAEGAASGKSEAAAAQAMKTFADDVRATIVKNLPEAERKMFEYAKGLTSARYEASFAHAVSGKIVQGLIKGTLRDVYSMTGEPLVKKYAPVVLEQMLGSGPELSLVKGLAAKVSSNPAALTDAIGQGVRALGQRIPVEIRDAIKREAESIYKEAKDSVVNRASGDKTP